MGFFKKLASLFSSSRSTNQRVVRPLRAPRIKVQEQDAVRFKPSNASDPGEWSVSNISLTGVAFIRNAATDILVLGKKYEGELSIADEKFLVSFNILRVSTSIVACQFSEENPALVAAIQRKLAGNAP